MRNNRTLLAFSAMSAPAIAALQQEYSERKAPTVRQDAQALLKDVHKLVSPASSRSIHNAQVDAQKAVKKSARNTAAYLVEAFLHQRGELTSMEAILDRHMATHPPYSRAQLERAVGGAMKKRGKA